MSVIKPTYFLALSLAFPPSLFLALNLFLPAFFFPLSPCLFPFFLLICPSKVLTAFTIKFVCPHCSQCKFYLKSSFALVQACFLVLSYCPIGQSGHICTKTRLHQFLQLYIAIHYLRMFLLLGSDLAVFTFLSMQKWHVKFMFLRDTLSVGQICV